MATLYEINSEIMSLIDEETGEISDYEAFEALNIARDEKINNIAEWVLNLEADAETYKAEKLRFAEKQTKAEKKAESLRILLDRELAGNKFKSAQVEISYRKSESVAVNDVYALPAEYQKFGAPTADKKALKEALKAGKQIDGAELVEKQNMIIK